MPPGSETPQWSMYRTKQQQLTCPDHLNPADLANQFLIGLVVMITSPAHTPLHSLHQQKELWSRGVFRRRKHKRGKTFLPSFVQSSILGNKAQHGVGLCVLRAVFLKRHRQLTLQTISRMLELHLWLAQEIQLHFGYPGFLRGRRCVPKEQIWALAFWF